MIQKPLEIISKSCVYFSPQNSEQQFRNLHKLEPILESFANVACNISLIQQRAGFPKVKAVAEPLGLSKNKGDSNESLAIGFQKCNTTITFKKYKT